MPRPLSPDVRRALVERAAELLARREVVSARSLAQGTGVSTMALYTYFGGMPGLWRAVRQEGFTRLGRALAEVTPSKDPVRDLARYGVAYVASALAHPHLYRTMFDAGFELEDPAAASRAFEVLVTGAARAREAGRFDPAAVPLDVATRQWAFGHGLVMLVTTGVLPRAALRAHAPPLSVALFVQAGDEPARCRRSVETAWADWDDAG